MYALALNVDTVVAKQSIASRLPTTDHRPPTTCFKHGKKTLDFDWTYAELGIGAGVASVPKHASWAIVGARNRRVAGKWDGHLHPEIWFFSMSLRQVSGRGSTNPSTCPMTFKARKIFHPCGSAFRNDSSGL